MSAFAQTGSITGIVTDENGETLPGVNIRLNEITLGAASNTDGEYTIINVPTGTYILVATFTGYKKFERAVQVGTGIVTLDIQLEEDILGLEEVVVTGYG
ncbi:MAG: carboxypeptidase-like regulatory domain-containing protein, partial [Bacteroidota bacterium]